MFMFSHLARHRHHRPGHRIGLALTLTASVAAIPLAALPGQARAGATGAVTTFTPGTPVVDTITDGLGATAPWNESQGDPSSPSYAGQAPGTLLPTYTPGGGQTGSGATAEPNVAVYPGASSTTDGVAPYPSGTVGTPGPLDGYCGAGDQGSESAGTPARQPSGTTLPFAPEYFPHVVMNADGTMTGYFDYRPKDADEALIAATSTDGGKSWTYNGEALEENPGYCPSADINDDGQGHANIITVDGVARLYTLQRPAGDMQGVGELVHTPAASPSDPLAGLPATEEVGIDPDGFVTGSSPVAVPTSGAAGVAIPLTTTGTANSTEQLVTGGFVDLTQDPHPIPANVINCTVTLNSNTMTGCTTVATGGVTVNPNDLIEQVIGYVSAAVAVLAGPNQTTGDGGLGTISVVTAAGGTTKGFTDALTGATFNNNAPNRAYVDGVAVYCSQGNANPTTKMEDCTTGPGGSTLSAGAGAPITSDPIIPATAKMTSGLVSPDGIVGVLPGYPGTPTGATDVMYTEKELSYYVAGTTTNSAKVAFGSSPFTLTFTPSPYESQDMPSTISVSTPVTVELGDNTTLNTFVPVTCTGLSAAATDSLTGCTVPAGDAADTYASTSLIGAPGAAIVSPATLAPIGEGSTTSAAKLFKNNEDLTVLRVAWTADGLNFSTSGLANGGIISGASNGSADYEDVTNPTTTVSPSNLNAFATAGTPDSTEMRWVGSAGTIISNPDGSYGLFLSGAWAADGDSDAFNQIFYTQSTDGQNWSVPTTVISTDYSFAASVAQDGALSHGTDSPLDVSAYYSGRAYGPSVVQNLNPDGTPSGSLTMVFAGYRLPKPIEPAGTVVGTTTSAQYTVGSTDPALYRSILTVSLVLSSSSPPAATPEAPNILLLGAAAIGIFGGTTMLIRRRRTALPTPSG
jgi:hypothetical protein